MTYTNPLEQAAFQASHHAHPQSAYYVLQFFADKQRWTPETLRARWDGAAAVLNWWQTLEPARRPPLDDLTREDAQAFIAHLETLGLARSTIKGYRAGARALTCSLRACRERPYAFEADYDPFVGVQPALPAKPRREIDGQRLACIANPRTRAKLEVLVALMALNISLPDACGRIWADVCLEKRALRCHPMRWVTLGVEAVRALERLIAITPERDPGKRVLWHPDTARRHLETVVSR